MAYAYVRSPFYGCITGKTQYCCDQCENPDDVCDGSCGNHDTCVGGSQPIDIAGGAVDLYLRVNYPNVRSLKTFVEIRCCNGTGCADRYRRTIKVELYECPNAIYYIGSVMYAHVDNPQVSNNTVYNLTSSSKKIGTVPSGSCAGCTSGPHTHMERSGGTRVAPCCGIYVTTSTNIYRWTYTPHAYCPESTEK